MSARKTEELARNMFAVGRMIREQAKKRAGKVCLSPMQMQCLLFIREDSPVMREAAKRLAITPPSATVLIRGLKRLGLVRQERDAMDHRAWRLGLTLQGEKIVETKLGAITQSLALVAEALTDAEKDELSRLLGKIADSLK